jgi:3-hydroxyisobutyrate dehydrogenase
LTEPLAVGSPVGFIGLGAMGRPMATRLAAQFPLRVFDVDPGALAFWDGGMRADPTAAGPGGHAIDGAEPAAGPSATAAGAAGSGADVEIAADSASVADGVAAVVLSLPDSAVVEAVVPELLGALSPGALIVDMSSSDPVSTRRLGDRAREAGVGFVDAPVSGGVAGAEAGTLTAMVGGQDCDVRAVGPLLDAMTDARFHVGGPGAGHAVKALNNLLSAAGIAITTEAIAIGSRFGVDPARMIEVFNASTGRNWATEYKFPEFVLQDRWDSGFRLGLQRKDVDTAVDLAAATATDAPLATTTAAAWRDAESTLGPDADHTEFARSLDHWPRRRDSR